MWMGGAPSERKTQLNGLRILESAAPTKADPSFGLEKCTQEVKKEEVANGH